MKLIGQIEKGRLQGDSKGFGKGECMKKGRMHVATSGTLHFWGENACFLPCVREIACRRLHAFSPCAGDFAGENARNLPRNPWPPGPVHKTHNHTTHTHRHLPSTNPQHRQHTIHTIQTPCNKVCLNNFLFWSVYKKETLVLSVVFVVDGYHQQPVWGDMMDNGHLSRLLTLFDIMEHIVGGLYFSTPSVLFCLFLVLLLPSPQSLLFSCDLPFSPSMSWKMNLARSFELISAMYSSTPSSLDSIGQW